MSETQWKTLDSAPYGRKIIVSSHAWESGCEVYWGNHREKVSDLSNWMDPPTHWTEMPRLPAPPSHSIEGE